MRRAEIAVRIAIVRAFFKDNLMIDLCCATLQNLAQSAPFSRGLLAGCGKVDIWSKYWGIVRILGKLLTAANAGNSPQTAELLSELDRCTGRTRPRVTAAVTVCRLSCRARGLLAQLIVFSGIIPGFGDRQQQLADIGRLFDRANVGLSERDTGRE